MRIHRLGAECATRRRACLRISVPLRPGRNESFRSRHSRQPATARHVCYVTRERRCCVAAGRRPRAETQGMINSMLPQRRQHGAAPQQPIDGVTAGSAADHLLCCTSKRQGARTAAFWVRAKAPGLRTIDARILGMALYYHRLAIKAAHLRYPAGAASRCLRSAQVALLSVGSK